MTTREVFLNMLVWLALWAGFSSALFLGAWVHHRFVEPSEWELIDDQYEETCTFI